MAFWIVASVATDLVERLRPPAACARACCTGPRQIPRAMVGMMIAHLGVAVFILGVTLVKTGEVERDVQMGLGDTTTIGGYDLHLPRRERRARAELPRRAGRRSRSARDGKHGRRRCSPEKRIYPASQSTDDRGGDRPRLHARPLRLARRAGRRRRLDRARLRQALRRLDLGRLPDHGARRPARRDRPALPRRAPRQTQRRAGVRAAAA